ncbi:MAG: multiheme c-type cytochrome, partial [Planctomycetota bacterium]
MTNTTYRIRICPNLFAACSLALALVMFLPACSKDDTPAPSTSPSAPVENASTTQPTPPIASKATSRRFPDAQYVGRDSCAQCHPDELTAWTDSHHDWSMKIPTDESMLGDFNNSTFVHNGVTNTFFKRDGQFMVNAEGPDGQMHDYPIKYAFGKTPLQQYLIEFPGGRLQTLSATWDTLNKEWFDLHEDEPIRILPNDELHWTTPSANWNFMCADCHSTDLQKNYDEATDTYNTTYKEINVSC